MSVNLLADFLRHKRDEKGLTQGELDVKAKLPKGTVGQLECGTKLFSDARIVKLAVALDVPEAEFYSMAKIRKSTERELVDAECDDLSRDELLEVALMLRKYKAGRLQSVI